MVVAYAAVLRLRTDTPVAVVVEQPENMAGAHIEVLEGTQPLAVTGDSRRPSEIVGNWPDPALQATESAVDAVAFAGAVRAVIEL